MAPSIAPWLSVRNSARAVDFYKSAFRAMEVYRLEDGGGVVAKLSVDGAELWLSDESPEQGNFSPESLNGGTVRKILTVADPDAVFARALAAGGCGGCGLTASADLMAMGIESFFVRNLLILHGL